MGILLLAFALAFAISVAVTRLARGWAHRYGHMDVPDDRKRHTLPVPRLGGVGIAAGVAAGLVAVGFGGGVSWGDAMPLLAGAGIVAALGLWDDLQAIGFKRRFAVQIVVAYAMVFAGWHLDVSNLPLLRALEPFEQGAFALPITILWTVGLINAMNLLDGLDGLAGGVSLVAFASLGLAYADSGDGLLLALCAVGVAATLGFLVFNVHPASIFMGDSGSTLLGFLLAMAGLRGVTGTPSLGLLAVPVVALGLPLLDTATTMIRRIVHGTSPFMPDADHLHHRVLARSHSVQRAVWALWGAGAMFGGLAFALNKANGSDNVQALCVLAGVVFAYIVVHKLRYVRLRVMWRKTQQRRVRRRARQASAVLPVGPPPVGPLVEPEADPWQDNVEPPHGDGATAPEPTASVVG